MVAPEGTIVTPPQFTEADMRALDESLDPAMKILTQTGFHHDTLDGTSVALYNDEFDITSQITLRDTCRLVPGRQPAMHTENKLQVVGREFTHPISQLLASSITVAVFEGKIDPRHAFSRLRDDRNNLYHGRNPEERSQVRAARIGSVVLSLDGHGDPYAMSGYLNGDRDASTDVVTKYFTDFLQAARQL